MVKELKKELSKLSGIDFFNPKYRDVFKKYFPNDTTENDVNDNEEDRLKEVLGEENEETKTPDTQENSTDTVEENAEDKKEETPSDEQGEETDKADADPTEEDAEDKGEDNAPETENVDSSEQTETNAEESLDNSTTDAPETTISEQNNASNELLEMKVELALVRAGIREDRLDAAKKLFMADIHSIEDLSKLKDLVQQYPEWIKQTRQEAQPFGMPLGDNGDGLTEEEKRLKAMGIDPRN